jgi:glutathione S-transferase
LETKYKGKGTELIPSKDAGAQGLFEQAASIETSYFDPYASKIVYERLFKKYKGLGEADEAVVASLKEQLNGKLDVYDKILSKQPYLAGQVN